MNWQIILPPFFSFCFLQNIFVCLCLIFKWVSRNVSTSKLFCFRFISPYDFISFLSFSLFSNIKNGIDWVWRLLKSRYVCSIIHFWLVLMLILVSFLSHLHGLSVYRSKPKGWIRNKVLPSARLKLVSPLQQDCFFIAAALPFEL